MTAHSTDARRRWIIMGVSSDLGRALAKAALARDDVVVGTVRQPEQIGAFELLAPGRALGMLLDVRDREQAELLISQAGRALGDRIEYLVNNASYGLLDAVEELTDAEIRDQFETNLFRVLNVTRAALPLLRAQGTGHLVFTSSIAALIGGPPGFGVYNASKHALEGMAVTLANEVAPFGLKVTLFEPCPFRTSFGGTSLRRAAPMAAYAPTVGKTRRFIEEDFARIGGDPDAAARAILRALDAPDPPRRLLLGRSALDTAQRQLNAMLAEIDAWKEVTLTADGGPGATAAV